MQNNYTITENIYPQKILKYGIKKGNIWQNTQEPGKLQKSADRNITNNVKKNTNHDQNKTFFYPFVWQKRKTKIQ